MSGTSAIQAPSHLKELEQYTVNTTEAASNCFAGPDRDSNKEDKG